MEDILRLKKAKSIKSHSRSKTESSVKSVDAVYIKQNENVQALRKKLESKHDNSEDIKKLYDNAHDFKIYKFEDNIFETKMSLILENNLGLIAFDYLPLFKACTSKLNGKKVTTLNYYKITLYEEDKIYNESQTEYNFFPNRQYQFFEYKEYSFLIEMNTLYIQKIGIVYFLNIKSIHF